MKFCIHCGQEATHQFKNNNWCCSKYISQCPEIRKRNSKSLKGNIPWNKDKTGIYSKEILNKMSIGRSGIKHSEQTKKLMSDSHKGKILSKKHRKKISKSNKLTINKFKRKYPTFAKIEEMRYEPGKVKVIQVHCKNHKCKNSKEQTGWFTPNNYEQFRQRIRAIELGDGGCYFYCCEECKVECPLYNLVSDPFKIKEELYTSEEYQTWRTTVLIREKYICEYCDEPATDVHHSRPQKLEPGFILDPDFGVACCEKHHYQYGHKKGTECSTGNLANKICI